MRTIDDIQAEIASVQQRSAPLIARLEILSRELRDTESRQWVAANKVKMSDVEMSSGDGKPWFGHVKEFITWMRENNCAKRWAEWNGAIYPTCELFQNIMSHDAPGRIEHLEESK